MYILLISYYCDTILIPFSKSLHMNNSKTTRPAVATAQTSESIRFINRLQVTSPISIVCKVKNKNSKVQNKYVSY